MVDRYVGLTDEELDKVLTYRLSSKLDKLRVLIDNPKIQHLKYAMERQKHEELSMTPTTKTKWQDVYEDMVRPAKHGKNINISHLKTKFQCLETIFELIDKPYVEQITFDDCKKINKLIYLVPKKWKERHPNQRLLDVLLPEDDTSNQAISASSIKKYITIFQEFLRYCRTQQLINADMWYVKLNNTILPIPYQYFSDCLAECQRLHQTMIAVCTEPVLIK